MLIDKLLELQQKSALVVHRQPFTDLFVLNRMPLISSTFDTWLMMFPYLNANFFSFPFCSDEKFFTGIYSRPLGISFCHSTGLGTLTVYGLRNRNLDGSVILSVKSNARNLCFIDRSFSNFHILRKVISITTRFMERQLTFSSNNVTRRVVPSRTPTVAISSSLYSLSDTLTRTGDNKLGVTRPLARISSPWHSLRNHSTAFVIDVSAFVYSARAASSVMRCFEPGTSSSVDFILPLIAKFRLATLGRDTWVLTRLVIGMDVDNT